MMKDGTSRLPMLRRLAAFTTDPGGGNPAGVWVGDGLPSQDEMQRIAAGVGDSETAFVAPLEADEHTVRYYSPEAEVSFCGHATVAAGVLLGELRGEGTYRLSTSVGEVPVVVERRDGQLTASLTSVIPRHMAVEGPLLAQVLEALAWAADELDPTIPSALTYAGAWHLVIAVKALSTLKRLDYDFEGLKEIMQGKGLTTVQLVWRESDRVFHARNPFPVGGVVEDPATGASAAALGGYLRDATLMSAPAAFVIRQGEFMGRPSRIGVSVPRVGGITVSGAAVPMEPPAGALAPTTEAG